jgi:hypothetical protein
MTGAVGRSVFGVHAARTVQKPSTAIDSGRLSRMCPLHLILAALVRWITAEQKG